MPRGSNTSTKTSRAANDPLARYRSMRDFKITHEPSGGRVQGGKQAEPLPFVIQKHAATRLHYDCRLGWNGVLKSWAVAKGPSYVPGDKRLAVQVEDHPWEYGDFEGIIPKGQYGGGTVMLWDRGIWEPHGDVEEGLRKGSLKFTLRGQKMKGSWALIRMGGRAANPNKPNWLLIKEHDAEERTAEDAPITEEAPNSVASGRDLQAIAKAEDRVWQSNRAENRASSTQLKAKVIPFVRKPLAQDWTVLVQGTPKEKLPAFIEPQLATLSRTAPTGNQWVHEIKLDGYRMQLRLAEDGSRVQLLTRNGLDWTHRMKSIAAAAYMLPVKSAILDGEVVVLTEEGTSSFADLQAAFQEGAKHELTYFVFDLLHLDGHNLRNLPLGKRKKMLLDVLSAANDSLTIRFSDHISGDGQQIFQKACGLGAEGIISKSAEGKYESGRGRGWVKVKCYREQEFVVGGFTLPSNNTKGIGALLLGFYRDGKLVYAGRTGTGFTQKTHRAIRDRLDKLRRATPAFAQIPSDATRDAIWIKPELVAQVSFSTWTADNLVRQASFKGLREDKAASEVRLEEPQSPKENGTAKQAGAKPSKQASATKHRGKAQASAGAANLPIRLSHANKVLDETSGVTKQALAEYYLAVADAMLPYVKGRPLTLVRCVDGSGKPCFYQKHKNQMLSGSFGTVNVLNRKTGAQEPYITLSTPEAIVELAQVGVLEVHPWGSRNDSLEKPDRIIIDLDPDEAIDWRTLTASAKEVRKRLRAAGLKSFVKTTGGKGLHVVAPIRAEHNWPEVKDFAHRLVLAMEKASPQLFLTKMTKAARKGKIYLDYLRNDRGSTAVAPFSPRARAGLPVAMPLSWSELDASDRPAFHVSDFESWRERLKHDPWKELRKTDQRLTLG